MYYVTAWKGEHLHMQALVGLEVALVAAAEWHTIPGVDYVEVHRKGEWTW